MEGFKEWFQTTVLQLPFLASEHGRNLDDLLTYIHLLMLVLFFGWLAYFAYVLFRFRVSRHPRANPTGVRSHFTSWVEVGVVLVEAVLLIGFSVPLWAKMVTNLPTEEEATVVRVLGRQFNWVAHYAGTDGVMGRGDPSLSSASDPFGLDRAGDANAVDDVVVQRDVVVPVGKPVVMHLTSLDVIHSLAIPAMRICQDAIPGMRIPVWFTPKEEGEYMSTCAQLCGTAHDGMYGVLKVVSPAEYDAWILDQSEKARAAAGQPVSYE